jgi:hypothetical protein
MVNLKGGFCFMSEFEVWVGTCHLQQIKDGAEYQCQAAVWADSYDTFRATLAAHLQNSHKLLWVEECMPVMQYITRQGQQARIGALARAVHPGHKVELGAMVGMGDDGQVVEPESYLNITEIEGVEPLDLQMGAWPLKTIPDALQEPLFGQPAPTEAEIEHYGNVGAVPPMKTYAILDAAKMPYLLTSLLEDSELRYQSLFQGQTQEDLKEHAPYLVELEDNNSFTRRLFTGPKGVNGLWEKELGIYVRSRAGFDELRKHFRKFTRVQDEAGKWYFFRFWEPIFGSILDADEFKKDVAPLTAIFAPQEPTITSVTMCRSSSCNMLRIDNTPSLRTSTWKLDEESKRAIKNFKTRADIHDIIQTVGQRFPDKHSAQPAALHGVSKALLKIGFRKREHFAMLLTYEALLGPDFIKEYESGKIEAIIQSSRSADEAVNTIKKFLQKAQP